MSDTTLHSMVICIGDPTQFGKAAYRLNDAAETRYAVRRLRADKMRTLDDLFDEFAAALQFPYYFGENYPAFAECLGDLDWIPAPGYLLLISNAAMLLSEEPVEFPTVMRILARITGEWPELQQKPFRVVLQCNSEEVEGLKTRIAAPVIVVTIEELSIEMLLGAGDSPPSAGE